jgi:hypothetical protein
MNAPENAVPILMREDSDGVATLTLNRPGQFNSLSEEMLTDLQAALDAIAVRTPSVRVVVIAGAGKAFCAGHDLKQMRANHSKAYMQEAVQAMRQGDDDPHRDAAAGDCAHPRHCHRRRLPAGRHVRSGGGGRGRRNSPCPASTSASSAPRPRWRWGVPWAASRPWKCCSRAISLTPPRRSGAAWSIAWCRWINSTRK